MKQCNMRLQSPDYPRSGGGLHGTGLAKKPTGLYRQTCVTEDTTIALWRSLGTRPKIKAPQNAVLMPWIWNRANHSVKPFYFCTRASVSRKRNRVCLGILINRSNRPIRSIRGEKVKVDESSDRNLTEEGKRRRGEWAPRGLSPSRAPALRRGGLIARLRD